MNANTYNECNQHKPYNFTYSDSSYVSTHPLCANHKPAVPLVLTSMDQNATQTPNTTKTNHFYLMWKKATLLLYPEITKHCVCSSTATTQPALTGQRDTAAPGSAGQAHLALLQAWEPRHTASTTCTSPQNSSAQHSAWLLSSTNCKE